MASAKSQSLTGQKRSFKQFNDNEKTAANDEPHKSGVHGDDKQHSLKETSTLSGLTSSKTDTETHDPNPAKKRLKTTSTKNSNTDKSESKNDESSEDNHTDDEGSNIIDTITVDFYQTHRYKCR